MSASREKKKRQELLAGGNTDPKTAKAAKEKAEARKTNILYGTLGIIFVVVAAALLIYNSSFVTRSRTAVTIDGEKYTVAEASYYYGQAYQNFLSSDTAYYMMLQGMLSTSTPLSAQTYPYDTSMTWADYFKGQAVESMRFAHALKKAAADDGMKLEDEDLAEFDKTVASVKESAETNNLSYSKYISNVYGSNVTTSVYESCLKDQMLASKYATQYRDSLTYTEDEIQDYYEENKNSYDVVDGAYVSISTAPETEKDEDGNTIEATDEEKAEALEAAKEAAQAILDGYKDGGDLEKLAGDNGGTYYGSEETRYSSGTTGDWLFDEARKEGDAAVLGADEESPSYLYVAVFHSRSRVEYPNYDVRHILITADTLKAAESEDTGSEDTGSEDTGSEDTGSEDTGGDTSGEDEEVPDEDIKAKAQEILDSWDGTEDGFAELAKEWSEDGNAEDGGIYEDVYWGQMVSEFQDWCYADGRKAGDTGIVQTSYGFHIMYFVGYSDEVYWHYACNNALVSEAYSEWADEMVEGVTAEVNESAMNAI